MHARVLIAGLAVAILVALAGVRAWNTWPPVGMWRIKRNREAMRAAVKEYLDGRETLEVAAASIGAGMRNDMNLGWALADDPPLDSRAAGTLTSWNLLVTPEGYAPDDPRLEPLFERAFYYFIGPEEWPAFEEQARERTRRMLEEMRRRDQSPPN